MQFFALMEVYEPREDSKLLAEEVRRLAHGSVLDMGTGSGIQAIAAAGLKRVKGVVAADISKEALKAAKKNAEEAGAGKKIRLVRSCLFKKLKKQRFDTIIFNPPYLPDDKEFNDKAIHGGKKGYELIERFFSEVNDYLAEDGIILIVFSSLTKKAKVDEVIERRCLEKELLEEKSIFFEKLFVYKISKSELLRNLERLGVSDVELLAKGHRGMVYSGRARGRKVAIKAQRKDTAAKNVAKKEARWLKQMNKRGIGPKLICAGSGYLIMEIIEGTSLSEFATRSSKAGIKRVLGELFWQCFMMDKMSVSKEEMHHPVKHVIIDKNGRAVLIDFERMHETAKPKNVTQLCQFIIRSKLTGALEEKGISIDKRKIISAAKEYRKGMDRKNFSRITRLIK